MSERFFISTLTSWRIISGEIKMGDIVQCPLGHVGTLTCIEDDRSSATIDGPSKDEFDHLHTHTRLGDMEYTCILRTPKKAEKETEK